MSSMLNLDELVPKKETYINTLTMQKSFEWAIKQKFHYMTD